MYTELLNTLLWSTATVFLYMNIIFFISLKKKRADIVDIAWGGAFIAIALTALLIHKIKYARAYLITFLVVIWGLRLATHIFIRNKGKSEDYRYQAWRAKWGSSFLIRSYLQIFMLQGLLALIISMPIIVVNSFTQPDLNLLDLFGSFVWIVGFIFESVGDWQLTQFLKDPSNRGHIIQSGLWHYTRHPNYFGEVTQWWGIFIIALSSPFGWFSIISPFTISFLILKVSGIPMLEKPMENNLEFQRYKESTNAFFPWKPKKIKR